jgi:hypothetical protein
MNDLAATLTSMNDQALALRLKTAGQHVLELLEAKALGEDPRGMLATAHALSDVTSEIESLLMQMAKPEGALPFKGEFVKVDVEVEPGSPEDKAAQTYLERKSA